ncbi:MAG: hypothetical protein J0L64_01905 [Acidobacteria bacterium]|nr:hypothetical protein [Acidobacteriota bacterium]
MTPLDPILRELGATHRREQAPDALDRELLRAFRRRHRRPWLWPALAAATATAALAAFLLAPSPRAETLALRVAAPAAPEVRFTPLSLRAAASAPKRPRPAAPRAPRAVSAPAPEIATDFFPLRPDPLMEPGEWLRIVRARIPRSELRRFGLAAAPVFSAAQQSPDVAADVVFGNDGTARAIRFIHYTR